MRTLLIIIIFLSSLSYVQAQKTPIRLIAKYSNSYKNGNLSTYDSVYWYYSGKRGATNQFNQVFDNRYILSWDTVGFIQKHKQTNTFDTNDSLISSLYETYDNVGLVGKTIIFYAYDANYNQVEKTEKSWINNAWHNFSKKITSYDALNRKVQELNQQGTGTATGWKDKDRTTNAYLNNTDKLTSIIIESNYSNTGLKNYSKILTNYDALGNQFSSISYLYDTASWKKQAETYFWYDVNNRLVSYSTYPFVSGIGKDSISIQYDGNGNIISNAHFQYSLNAFANISKNTYTYNPSNYMLTDEHFTGDTSGWLPKTLKTYEFNSQNLEVLSYAYDIKNGIVDTIFKNDNSYDIRNNLIQLKTTNWINKSPDYFYYDDRTYNQLDLITVRKFYSIKQGSFIKGDESFYIYDTTQYPLDINDVTLKNINTYPNPFSSSFSISYESNIASDVSMLLYDSKGAIITKTYSTANVGENTITWDCGKTLPTGFYTYELHIGNETHSGKVMAK